MPLAAGTRLGPYQILGLIGAGGMGEVYEARDTRLDRTVAIKVPPADLSSDRDRRSRHHRSGLSRHAGSSGSGQKAETSGRPPVER
jgi:serine/threonine protein kinase